ncbi:hypothetical protein AYL99_06967 [Fonsecaea erecta]|uniref:Velvet domain-containing protein n=1 Tax=Fonsecaea erecta TaxID=1367422 RepID=A0A178ZIP8_9EURO|nr:hypothetical protein AYL99_06967 [Fonsecaea erecta]OAP59669.1 hypothetical protein AYL99_06967 [Fonsecaea erecta]
MQQQHALGAPELTKLGVNRNMYRMIVKQQPGEGQVLSPQKRASAKKPSNDRVSLDPPAVVELVVVDDDPTRSWLHSPYLFCTVELVRLDDKHNGSNTLSGTLTSSLHVVKMSDGKAHGYFVFGDLIPNSAGKFFLRFTLFEMRRGQNAMFAEMLNTVNGATFEVYARNKISPLPQSTDLTRALSEGGVKVRVRKEPTRRLQRNKANWGFQGFLGGHGQAVPASVYGQAQLYPQHGLHWGQQGSVAYSANNAIDIRDRLSVQHHGMAPPFQGSAQRQNAPPMGPPIPQQPQPLHRLQHEAFLQEIQQQPVSQPLPPLQPSLLLHETPHMLMLPPPPPQPQPQHQQQQHQSQPPFPTLPQILPQHFSPLPAASYTVRDDGTSNLEYSTATENQTFYATSSANPRPLFTMADDQAAYTTSSGVQLLYATALEDHMIPTASPGTDSAYATSSSGADHQHYQQSAPHVPGRFPVPAFNSLQETYDPSSSLGEFL